MKSKHTDEQLIWLKDRLPEYENRAAAQVRGDAKGFALKCAEEYITKWGLGTGPEAEKESQVKERIYTWFKNTSARGKEARRKHAQSKIDERESSGLQGSPGLAATSYTFMSGDPGDDVKKGDILPFPENRHASLKSFPQGSPISPGPAPHIFPANMASTSAAHGVPHLHPQQPSPIAMSYGSSVGPPSSQGTPITPVVVGVVTPYGPLTQSFLQPGVSPQNLAQVVQHSSANLPYHAGLSSAIQSLLIAATSINTQHSDNPGGAVEGIIELMKRYKAMLPHLPSSLTHFGCSGPQAGIKALRVSLRKNSTWIAYSTSANATALSPPSPSPASSSIGRRTDVPIHDQMHRSYVDRTRRKEYFIWSMVHSAAYEVGLLGPSKNPIELGLSAEQRDDDDGSARLAESVAKDGLWETEESDWLAGALLLRAVIRRFAEDPTIDKTGPAAASIKQSWEELVIGYEARWKELRDESRQASMEDALNSCRRVLDAIG